MPGLYDPRIVEVIPQLAVVGDVVLDRLESLCAVIDHLTGHVAEGFEDPVNVEILFIGPAGKGDAVAVGEIEGRGEEQQIAQSVIGAHRGIDGGEDGPDAPAQHAELLATGDGFDFANRAGQIFEGVVVELEMPVFEAGHAPIQEVQVIALADHEFDETVPGAQIENRGAVHNGEDQQEGGSMPALGGDHRLVAVELGLVQGPDQFFGRLGNGRFGGEYPGKGPQSLLQRNKSIRCNDCLLHGLPRSVSAPGDSAARPPGRRDGCGIPRLRRVLHDAGS